VIRDLAHIQALMAEPLYRLFYDPQPLDLDWPPPTGEGISIFWVGHHHCYPCGWTHLLWSGDDPTQQPTHLCRWHDRIARPPVHQGIPDVVGMAE